MSKIRQFQKPRMESVLTFVGLTRTYADRMGDDEPTGGKSSKLPKLSVSVEGGEMCACGKM